MKNPATLQNLLAQSFESEKNLRQFSSLTSSELSTLLATILGELETLKSESASLTPHFETTFRALEKAIFLSRNLRYFSGTARPDSQLTDLSQLLLDTISQVESELTTKKIQFDVKVEASVFLVLDPQAFEQALLNLLWFAAHEIPNGGQIEVQLHLISQSIHLNLSSEPSHFDETLSESLEPIVIESLGSEHLTVWGLQVARSIFETHSGKFQVFRSTQKTTHFHLEMPLNTKIHKPHLFSEKRRFKRVPVNLDAQVGTPRAQSPLSGTITVLGLGGCFVAMSREWVEKINPEEPLSIRISIEGGASIEITQARVAYRHVLGEHSGLGIEFLDPNSRAKNLLAALVRAHAS